MATSPAEIADRRAAVARTPVLSRLRERLRGQLEPLRSRPIYLPERKALLSQDGGSCPEDGSRLRFDPLSPDRHQCPRCGRMFEGERHHRAWITRYHVWLSERAVHCALLSALDQDAALAGTAAEILEAYARRYRSYPNADNVLGPTRLFFSTYLESIWLSQVVIAASLLDGQGFAWPETRENVAAMVEESSGLIRSFDEGWSNRQAWNSAALIGAGALLGDAALTAAGLDGEHGVRAALRSAVSSDGLWFEGENYHFFALRGLLLAAELARPSVDLYHEPVAGEALAAMYVAPLKTVLPDLTLPARSDAPYGVSIRQARFAELWEIGRARTGQADLDTILERLYAPDVPEGEDYGPAEMSEQEQNRAPQRLGRDRLSWKALLWMREDEPAASGASVAPGPVLLADHGLAVIRQGGRYLSMECGGRPGGHGHPDLLHLTLHWSLPWLMDPGASSYVSPSLRWYRSTQAHNAPALTGTDQLSRAGWCSAFESAGGWAWMQARAEGILGPKTGVTRSVIAGPDWVLDVVDVDAPHNASVDLPLHPLPAMMLPAGVERRGVERPVQHTDIAQLGGALPRFSVRAPGTELLVSLAPRKGEGLFVGVAPGPPDAMFADGPPTEFLVRRASGGGRWVQAYAMVPVALEDRGREIRVTRGAAVDTIRMASDAVEIRTATGETVQLSGRRERKAIRVSDPPLPPVIRGTGIHLGATEYRRAEAAYDPAFSAAVNFRADGNTLAIDIDVTKPALHFRRASDPDPRLDNEPPDIHSDGVQLYVGRAGWEGYVAVPDPDTQRVNIRSVAGSGADPARLAGTWERTGGGYSLHLRYQAGRALRRGDRVAVNVVVNQMETGRQRRAGQLALSGGGGWVYLRGDRESPNSAVIVEIA